MERIPIRSKKRMLCIKAVAALLLFAIPTYAEESSWTRVDDGLLIGNFVSKITVVKIDPAKYALKLLSISELKHEGLPANEWCRRYNLIAAVNAGMFLTDYKTNVGYMKNFKHINNRRINSYFSVAAFNPVDPANPPFRIYDIDDVSMNHVVKSYNTVIQNLRLMKRPAQNRWSKQERKWSEVALGEDRNGNALFIFSREPYSMHDFNNTLRTLDIGLECAQHLEGGPEASLYFSHNHVEIKAFGSFETGFIENDRNNGFWPVPNVIGVTKKK